MRKILSLAIALCILQFVFAESISPAVRLSQSCLLVRPQAVIVPEVSVQKKLSLKERLLLKWYKRKMNRTVSEEKQKKAVNLFGYLSLGASILSPLILISVFAITSYAAVEVLSVFAFLLLPVAVILGIISLHKRKKLADKKGTTAIPGLIGIILSSFLLILFLIVIISFSNGFSGSFIR